MISIIFHVLQFQSQSSDMATHSFKTDSFGGRVIALKLWAVQKWLKWHHSRHFSTQLSDGSAIVLDKLKAKDSDNITYLEHSVDFVDRQIDQTRVTLPH